MAFIDRRIPFFERTKTASKNMCLIELLFKLLLRPATIIPNFNYDILYECAEMSAWPFANNASNPVESRQLSPDYYFCCFSQLLCTFLKDRIFASLNSFLVSEFKSTP